MINDKPTSAVNVRGTISGFSKITVGEPVPGSDGNPTDPVTITLAEVLEEIKYIKTNFDHNRLYDLLNRLKKHMSDYQNPHKLTADQLGLDVVKDLYFLWLGEDPNTLGNPLTWDDENSEWDNDSWVDDMLEMENFLKIIFQELDVGTIADIESRNMNKLMTFDVAEAYIDKHKEDPDAHAGLVAYHLPGTAKQDAPLMSFAGRTGLSIGDWGVLGNPDSVVSVMTPSGYLEEFRAKYFPIDFSTGVGCLVACGSDIKNLIAPSSPFGYGTTAGASMAPGVSVYADGLANKALKLVESATGAEHSYLTGVYPLEPDNTYTFSVYIKPSAFPIMITDSTGSARGVILTAADTVMSVGSGTIAIHLHNQSYFSSEYVRVGYTFTTGASEQSIRFIINRLSEGGGKTYQGTLGTDMFTIDAMQLEKYVTMTPHVRNTTNMAVTRKGYIFHGRLFPPKLTTGTTAVKIRKDQSQGTPYKVGPIVVSRNNRGVHSVKVDFLNRKAASFPTDGSVVFSWRPESFSIRTAPTVYSNTIVGAGVVPNFQIDDHIFLGGYPNDDPNVDEILGGCLVNLEYLFYYTSFSSKEQVIFLSGEHIRERIRRS